MIPEFPEFKNLELSDKEEIEDLTRQFPPYSDFHFITIYCWDIDNNTLISKHNGNLIIKQIDCLSEEQFFSFIGVNSVPETVTKISSFLNDNKLPLIFRWMPEITVNCLNGLNVSITDDSDFFDYIYDVPTLQNAQGGSYNSYRRQISRFDRTYQSITTKLIDINNPDYKNQVKELFVKWSENKETENKFCEPIYENKALNKLLSTAHKFTSLATLGIFDKDEMIAFSINELPNREYASLLFLKADTNYIGVYQLLMKETINLFNNNKIKFFSFESDLGLESLKESKLRYHPTSFLKKYKIEICN